VHQKGERQIETQDYQSDDVMDGSFKANGHTHDQRR
jgi:hypothetical protein